ncbi:MAG: 4-carboxy-4-hydroxy-2-oxoadipate aldolase/oxaloacetate decarboxylase [Terracidiphilus sp.]
MGTVIRKIRRSPTDKLDLLRSYGVATVHEAIGRTGLMKPYLRPMTPGQSVAGNAVTVLVHPGDNTMMHVAIEVCQPDDVLVVAVSSETTDAMLGELLATSLLAHGVRGVILDAGCRDVSEMIKMGFPVWSRAISAKGTVKATLGQVNTPVVCAGVLTQPGDLIVADDDGVVVVPFALVDAAIEQSAQRLAKEAAKRARLKAGELNLDIEAMRPWLEKSGLRYYDSIEEVETKQQGS